jgi:hypothetical protein
VTAQRTNGSLRGYPSARDHEGRTNNNEKRKKMKVQIPFKDPDAIHEIINARLPLPKDEDDITPRMEKERDEFSDEYFEYGDYGCIEIDTDTLTARLLPVREWE